MRDDHGPPLQATCMRARGKGELEDHNAQDPQERDVHRVGPGLFFKDGSHEPRNICPSEGIISCTMMRRLHDDLAYDKVCLEEVKVGYRDFACKGAMSDNP